MCSTCLIFSGCAWLLYLVQYIRYWNFLTPQYQYQRLPKKSHIGWALLTGTTNCIYFSFHSKLHQMNSCNHALHIQYMHTCSENTHLARAYVWVNSCWKCHGELALPGAIRRPNVTLHGGKEPWYLIHPQPHTCPPCTYRTHTHVRTPTRLYDNATPSHRHIHHACCH